jgi:hypothetical protein
VLAESSSGYRATGVTALRPTLSLTLADLQERLIYRCGASTASWDKQGRQDRQYNGQGTRGCELNVECARSGMGMRYSCGAAAG